MALTYTGGYPHEGLDVSLCLFIESVEKCTTC